MLSSVVNELSRRQHTPTKTPSSEDKGSSRTIHLVPSAFGMLKAANGEVNKFVKQAHRRRSLPNGKRPTLHHTLVSRECWISRPLGLFISNQQRYVKIGIDRHHTQTPQCMLKQHASAATTLNPILLAALGRTS